MMEKREKGELIAYFVKRLRKKDEDMQIGKTVIQKMVYLFGLNSGRDFDYSMYHYGPFSKQVAWLLDLAQKNGYVDISWNSDKGYFIEPSGDIPEDILDNDIKRDADAVIDRYGGYNAIDLSLIATGLYVKNNFDHESEEKLVDIVLSFKSDYGEERIRELLIKEEIITQ